MYGLLFESETTGCYCFYNFPGFFIFYAVTYTLNGSCYTPGASSLSAAGLPSSVTILAEISLRSTRKIFIFYYKKIYLLDQSIQKRKKLILKKTSLLPSRCEREQTGVKRGQFAGSQRYTHCGGHFSGAPGCSDIQ